MARMNDDRKPRRVRRQFTAEFKAGAVRLDEGKTIAEVARDLDVVASVPTHSP